MKGDPVKRYRPSALAELIFDRLEEMEQIAATPPNCNKFRKRCGLICAPEFRGLSKRGDVENAITRWLATFFPNAQSQVLHHSARIPDIVFSFDDARVYLEAKPVWQRWITTGETEYAGAIVDAFGRSTGNYAANNINQLLRDRDKLRSTYVNPEDRHLLLALVFQRPGELDQQLIHRVGADWSVRSRHIVDLCNPPDDNIGLTAMLFWPNPNR